MTQQLEDAMTWRPIETAPKDGTNVLLVNRKGNMATGLWQGTPGVNEGWWLRGGNEPNVFFNDHHGPTHWMPLPEAPGSSAGFEVRIDGPDDVIPFADELAAHRHANAVNQTYIADCLKHPDPMDQVLCVATVHRIDGSRGLADRTSAVEKVASSPTDAAEAARPDDTGRA